MSFSLEIPLPQVRKLNEIWFWVYACWSESSPTYTTCRPEPSAISRSPHRSISRLFNLWSHLHVFETTVRDISRLQILFQRNGYFNMREVVLLWSEHGIARTDSSCRDDNSVHAQAWWHISTLENGAAQLSFTELYTTCYGESLGKHQSMADTEA